MAAISYWLLQSIIIQSQGPDSLLRKAVRGDWKGRLSPLLYVIGVGLSLSSPLAGGLVYALVAVIWLVPDRRIELALQES